MRWLIDKRVGRRDVLRSGVTIAPTQIGSVLVASDAAADDYFGIGCALSSDGSVLAVGAYQWEGSNSNQGGVYIYDWNGSAWTMRGSVLTASDAAADDNFGASCALSSDGSVLTVGAQQWEGSNSTQGGVYTYVIGLSPYSAPFLLSTT